MQKLRIVFCGTPVFGLPCLEVLRPHDLLAVYTQPDKPAGRGKKLQMSAVKHWALQHHIAVYQPLRLKHEVAALAALNPDVIIVVAYGLLLSQAILDLPKYGCINVHASLLPRWRGASPIQQVILNGEQQSGITIMQMAAGLDTGDILRQSVINLDLDETTASLHDKLSQLAPEALLAVINNLQQLKAQPQDDMQATYAGKINKADAQINWTESAIIIDRKIRAFYDWPIAFTYVNKDLLRIHKAHIINEHAAALSGTILNINKYGMLVATGDQQICIQELQFAGGKKLAVSEWLHSGKALGLVGMIMESTQCQNI